MPENAQIPARSAPRTLPPATVTVPAVTPARYRAARSRPLARARSAASLIASGHRRVDDGRRVVGVVTRGGDG